ncbi:hypothetical protein B0O80DRAFT_505130 [Mortierella sp. GBAus27b]|nr:hypothetical protein B0O80DRAFT_505130 [Mortierella sp. GBAus27b]
MLIVGRLDAGHMPGMLFMDCLGVGWMLALLIVGCADAVRMLELFAEIESQIEPECPDAYIFEHPCSHCLTEETGGGGKTYEHRSKDLSAYHPVVLSTCCILTRACTNTPTTPCLMEETVGKDKKECGGSVFQSDQIRQQRLYWLAYTFLRVNFWQCPVASASAVTPEGCLSSEVQ